MNLGSGHFLRSLRGNGLRGDPGGLWGNPFLSQGPIFSKGRTVTGEL